MRIIISPAKKMKVNTDEFPVENLPIYIEESKQILERIRAMSLQEQQHLWKCNDQLAELNHQRFAQMDLEQGLTPAILAYEGLQYQHMAPIVFTDGALDYVKKHLRILSGFYGVLAPMDGVVPYRLEMQAALKMGEWRNLYEFWKDKLYGAVLDEDHIILNLASREYSRCIEKYLQPQDRMITVVFGEWKDGRVKQKGTFAKMARGEMVCFMAENNIQVPEKIREAEILGYRYSREYSSEEEWVFLK